MHVRFRDTLPALARQNYNYSKGLVCLSQALRGAPAPGLAARAHPAQPRRLGRASCRNTSR